MVSLVVTKMKRWTKVQTLLSSLESVTYHRSAITHRGKDNSTRWAKHPGIFEIYDTSRGFWKNVYKNDTPSPELPYVARDIVSFDTRNDTDTYRSRFPGSPWLYETSRAVASFSKGKRISGKRSADLRVEGLASGRGTVRYRRCGPDVGPNSGSDGRKDARRREKGRKAVVEN